MSEQLNLELEALRTENGNLKAALQTAERLIGERDMQLDGMSEAAKNARASALLHNVAQLPPRPPYGIHGNKPPHFIWPEPGKVPFNMKDLYDPMSLSNRDKPLNLSSHRESPHRRRTDFEREAED